MGTVLPPPEAVAGTRRPPAGPLPVFRKRLPAVGGVTSCSKRGEWAALSGGQ